jgi:hypothetical protein
MIEMEGKNAIGDTAFSSPSFLRIRFYPGFPL